MEADSDLQSGPSLSPTELNDPSDNKIYIMSTTTRLQLHLTEGGSPL